MILPPDKMERREYVQWGISKIDPEYFGDNLKILRITALSVPIYSAEIKPEKNVSSVKKQQLMGLKGYSLCSIPVITDIGHTCYYILFFLLNGSLTANRTIKEIYECFK